MKYLIDGYNLIFECGLQGRQTNAESLARARNELLQTLATELSITEKAGVTVVFDAKKQMLSGQQERERFGKIVVLYSIHYEDADEMIERLIRQHAVPKDLVVVSSDHRIHKAALRRKATPIDSGDWFDWLQSGADREIPDEPPIPDDARRGDGSDSLFSDEEMNRFQTELQDLEQENFQDYREWPPRPPKPPHSPHSR